MTYVTRRTARPGKKQDEKGDRVDVEVPAGTIHFEILDISI